MHGLDTIDEWVHILPWRLGVVLVVPKIHWITENANKTKLLVNWLAEVCRCAARLALETATTFRSCRLKSCGYWNATGSPTNHRRDIVEWVPRQFYHTTTTLARVSRSTGIAEAMLFRPVFTRNSTKIDRGPLWNVEVSTLPGPASRDGW